MQYMKKIFILLAVISLGISIGFVANAANQNLSGYIYSGEAGWISLNCANTNSCDKIDYGVAMGENGKLSGFGYSQNNGWINFNPNYGGMNINSDDTLSGWAFSEKENWIRIDKASIVSADNLQKEITSAQNTVAEFQNQPGSLSDSGVMTLLNNLCSQFLSKEECNIFNN
jgi:hypothetical protein